MDSLQSCSFQMLTWSKGIVGGSQRSCHHCSEHHLSSCTAFLAQWKYCLSLVRVSLCGNPVQAPASEKWSYTHSTDPNWEKKSGNPNLFSHQVNILCHRHGSWLISSNSKTAHKSAHINISLKSTGECSK